MGPESLLFCTAKICTVFFLSFAVIGWYDIMNHKFGLLAGVEGCRVGL
jgi:hypothetical protein